MFPEEYDPDILKSSDSHEEEEDNTSSIDINELERLLGFGPDSPNLDIKPGSKKEQETTDGRSVMLGRMVRHKILDREEERMLFEAYTFGSGSASQDAYDKIFLCNLRLVLNETKRYLGRGLTLDDLFQEGVIGLNTAIRKFDLSKGNRFSTYAVNWIRQAMGRAVQDKGRTIRVPINLQESKSKLNKVSNLLSQQLGRMPTEEEVACCVPDMSPEKIQEASMVGMQTLSMEANAFKDGTEEEMMLGEIIPDGGMSPEEISSERSRGEYLRKVMRENLSGLEYRVLCLRFGFDGEALTAKQTGVALGLPPERVRQIEKSSKEKLANRKLDLKSLLYVS